ncbi:hypothetical protein SNK03_005391 [Fusarium graminearum]
MFCHNLAQFSSHNIFLTNINLKTGLLNQSSITSKIPIKFINMNDNILHYGNQLMALVPGLIGLNLLVRPEATLQQMEFTIPSEPKARQLTRGLARVYGIRNVVIGSIGLNLSLTRDPKLINMIYLGGLAMCVTDGIVAKSVIGHGEWLHWVFAPICIAGAAANYYLS